MLSAIATSTSPLSPFRRQSVISRRTRACIPESSQRPLEPQKNSQFDVRVRQPFSTSRSSDNDVIENGDLDDTTTDGEDEEDGSIKLREIDLEEQFIRGSGPGGQKINKSSVCVVRCLNGDTL